MDAPIVVALITSSASVVIAISGTWWAARQSRKGQEEQRNLADAQSRSQIELEKLKHELDQSSKIEERSSAAKLQLDRYREPLLAASNELGDRIDNIRNREFLFYLTMSDQRAETALQSTLYRFAQYVAYIEILYTNVSVMHFESDAETKVVASLLREISRTFATDSLDWSEMSNRPRLMLWREEQRAIGELVCEISKEGTRTCVGYAAFVNDYSNRYSKWLATFVEDLKADEAVNSERLARLQEMLAKLVIQLDEGRAYMQRASDGSFMWPGWIARATKEPN